MSRPDPRVETRRPRHLPSGAIEEGLYRVGAMLCRWAYALEQRRERFLPRCPDCNIGPNVGDDQECEICLMKYEAQREERYG